MKLKRLEDEYSRYIISPQKNLETIISLLKTKVDCVEQSIQNEGSFFVEAMEENVFFSIYNIEDRSKNDFIFICYSIEENEKSEMYYSDLNDGKDKVIVDIEKCTGYIYSNSSKLFLELVIERGINTEDIELRNVFYQDYLSKLYYYFNNDE